MKNQILAFGLIILLSSFLISCDGQLIASKEENNINNNIITEAHISVDTTNYTGTTTDQAYDLVVKVDNNYEFINITLTAKESYQFSNNFKLSVNSKLVSNIIWKTLTGHQLSESQSSKSQSSKIME